MKKFLIIPIIIAVLSRRSHANDKPNCEIVKNFSPYEICYDSGILLSVSPRAPKIPSPDLPSISLDLKDFDTIAPGAFKGLKLSSLHLSHRDRLDETPKPKNFTPESFDDMDSKSLHLINIEFSVNPNPFRSLKSVTEMTLKSNGFESFPVEFFDDFPHLNDLTLRNLNLITKISPELFSKINEGLKRLVINDRVMTIEPKSFDRFHNLTSLTVNGGQLYRLRSDMFAGLQQLDHLEFSYNGIREINPNTFHGLHIRFLNLGHNKISKIEIGTFYDLPLSYLNLENNEISKIKPEVFRYLPIAALYLAYNRLEEIPTAAFRNLANLEVLDVSHNRIRVINASAFQNCSKLQLLYLGDNQIDHIEPGSFFGAHSNYLDLKNNRIQVLESDTFQGLRLDYLLVLEGNNITTIQPGALKAIEVDGGRIVHLAFRNATQFLEEIPNTWKVVEWS